MFFLYVFKGAPYMCQEVGINGSDHPNLPLLKSGLFHPMIDGSPFDPKFL